MTEQRTHRGDYGVITDAGVDQLRRRIGIEKVPTGQRWPHNTEVTADGIRRFAFGYGDDNPIYIDPEYAANTRWEGLIAPPMFIWTMGERVGPPAHDPATKELMRGDPLRGVGALQADVQYELFRPLRLEDRLWTRESLVGIVDKQSSYSRRAIHSYVGKVGWTQSAEVAFYQRGMWVRHERGASKDSNKEVLAPEPYSQLELDRIDAAYDAEERRGSQQRFWEDVTVGDEPVPRVRGPLKLTDFIIWHMGWGLQMTPPFNFRLQRQHRQRKAGMYTPNTFNVPDTVQRMHWDEDWALRVGMPARYDYGGLRETFLAHLMTDWIGDDGWLWKLEVRHRNLVFIGDTSWVHGRVTGKGVIDGRHQVTLDVWCENQRGLITSEGSAVVLLPSASGPVVLPDPPSNDPGGVIKADIEALASEGGS